MVGWGEQVVGVALLVLGGGHRFDLRVLGDFDVVDKSSLFIDDAVDSTTAPSEMVRVRRREGML